MKDDLYQILGVARDASADDIRKAYRKAARTHHPDLNPGDAAAEARFKEVSAAYEVLNNPEKRALYDELGPDAEKIGYDPERAEEYRQWKRRADAAAGFGGGVEGFEGFEGFGGAGGPSYVDLEDLIGDMFGGGARRGPRKGRDIEAALMVSFRDAARGTKAHVDIPKASGGSARVALTIPAGIEEGQRLRLAGQGQPGREGGPPGDLYVRIGIEPHPLFTRDGSNLSLTLPITVAEALVGGAVEVPTLDGSLKLTVPAGVANGQKMRLRGKGIAPASGPPGDLIVELSVVLPPRSASAEARERIAQELAALYDHDVRARTMAEAKR